jgi:hypothetical protein
VVRSTILIVVAAAFLVGCAQKHAVTINSGIVPAPVASPRLSGGVAVLCADTLRSYRHHVDSVQVRSEFHSYDFEIGAALCNALVRSVGSVYATPVRVAKRPSPDRYPVVIVFSLKQSQIEVSFEERLTPSARALSTFAVTMALSSGRTMAPIRSSAVIGRAFLIRALGNVSSREAEKVFAAAIEASIQQLADNAAALLTQWATEVPPPSR